MSVDVVYRWHEDSLHSVPVDGAPTGQLVAADSWRVEHGKTLALSLHRERFVAAIEAASTRENLHIDRKDVNRFWDAASAVVPRDGAFFPRVDLHLIGEIPQLSLRLRAAPDPQRSVVVATLPGGDPRTEPTVKGPDLARMAEARQQVSSSGAGEAIILNADGFVVEGAYSGLLWWRGNILCSPLAAFDRIDSVTVRSVLALATALGIETYEEPVTPAELDGTELWALSALHGPRIVTSWVDGPAMAELPGRLQTWRSRLGALRQPV